MTENKELSELTTYQELEDKATTFREKDFLDAGINLGFFTVLEELRDTLGEAVTDTDTYRDFMFEYGKRFENGAKGSSSTSLAAVTNWILEKEINICHLPVEAIALVILDNYGSVKKSEIDTICEPIIAGAVENYLGHYDTKQEFAESFYSEHFPFEHIPSELVSAISWENIWQSTLRFDITAYEAKGGGFYFIMNH